MYRFFEPEFREETNITTEYKISKKPIYVYKDKFISFYTYLALFKTTPEINLNKEEHLEYKWFDINNIPQNLMPQVKKMFLENYNKIIKYL